MGDNEASLLRRAGDALMLNARGHVPVGIGIRGGRVAISVGDAGIGIAPDRLEAVFEPIGRADGSITRRFVPPDLREAAEAGNARGGRARRGGGVRDHPGGCLQAGERGIEAIRAIRRLDRARGPAAASILAPPADACRRGGMVAHLSKRIERAALLATLQEVRRTA